VRGFWGDIINSPYFTHGVEVSRAREKEQFYKKAFEEHKHVYAYIGFGANHGMASVLVPQ
jgi:hypothetical protein